MSQRVASDAWNMRSGSPVHVCGEHLDEVEAHCDALLPMESRLLRLHLQPPADLIQNINAAVQQRATLQQQFWHMIPRVRFHEHNAVLLHGADVRAIHRAMRRIGQGILFWYRVGRTAGTHIPSIQRNALTRGFPLAPGGLEYDWVIAEMAPMG
ncbi:hypothetical protein RHSIM_Rhsim13G0218600 [Rhododendron simsii]|uniref:Uncharacterized protein n=1 Tax=Rhododendron simsii TaxID=118357 RepID=A0A834G0C2_RHOSS|nr:hypothetical protein RHSIM_Rhsim13G0218600 [Rhododendron simsii]